MLAEVESRKHAVPYRHGYWIRLAPAEVFDALLMERVTKDWRKVVRVIAETMGNNMEPYIQVGDLMLLTRIVALVEQGKLMAHGDPWSMRMRMPFSRLSETIACFLQRPSAVMTSDTTKVEQP